MKTCIVILLFFACSAGLCMAAVSGSDFSRYGMILSRKPFGESKAPPAPGGTAVNLPAVPVESFAKYLKMIAVTDDELGTRVGLYDDKSKQSFFIDVGGTSDGGIQLVEADFDEGSALLRKGEEISRVYIDGKENKSEESNAEKNAVSSNTSHRHAVPSLTGSDASSARTRMISYMERRRLRKEQEEKEAARRIEEAAKQRVETVDKEKMIREYNLELIRAKGKKGQPLPIELTPEEDAMLVKEGILPPQ